MTLYYTGIGSRKTPPDIQVVIRDYASLMERRKYTLRSGGSNGADTAFESGCSDKQIFIPWDGFSGKKISYPIPLEAKTIASKLHPYWTSLTNPAQALMARNVLQILGPNLNERSQFVICWTPDGCKTHATRTSKTGNTGLAISLANLNNIPVFNLADDTDFNHIYSMLY